MKIKVKFPDGVKEVPGHVHVQDYYYDFQGLGAIPPISKPTPDPVPGYRFLEVLGSEYHWVAYKVNEYE